MAVLPEAYAVAGAHFASGGRRCAFDIPASMNADTSLSGTIDLISYDDFDLQCLKKDGALKRGSGLKKVYGNSSFVLAASDADSAWRIGDTVHINGETLTIAGLLKNDPFSEDGLTHGELTLISSGETFVRLTGEEDYALVMVQTTGGATNADVRAIQAAAGETFSFRICARRAYPEPTWPLCSASMRFWR